MLRSSGIRGYRPEPAGKEKGFWFPILSTQPFSSNWTSHQVFQPVLSRLLTDNHSVGTGLCLPSLYCRDPHSMSRDSISSCSPHCQNHGKTENMRYPGELEPLKNTNGCFISRRGEKRLGRKVYYSVEEMGHGLKTE